MYKTSNPAFNKFLWDDAKSQSAKMTVRGILVKSLLMLAIIATLIIAIWKLYITGIEIKWLVTGAIIAAIIISIIISVRPHWAHLLVPLYAVAKGVFLGGTTSYTYEKFPNLPYQAIGVTIVTFFTMLLLYQSKIIVVTKQLKSVVITATASIFLVYLISWILSFFDVKTFIGGTSWLAIIFNVVAAIIASLTLLLDFNFIENQKNKAPKQKEWIATWGLLVSIIWLYVEILRFMRSMSIKF